MKNRLSDKRGFTALEIVLVVVILAAIGLVGYKAFQASRAAKPAEEKTSTKSISVSDLGIKVADPDSTYTSDSNFESFDCSFSPSEHSTQCQRVHSGRIRTV